MSHSGQYTFKMPDLGEGTVEAEIVRWYVKPGDSVVEDQAIVEVMTDKATVEVPAPVTGRVLSVSGTPGDKVAVGSPLIVFESQGSGGPLLAAEAGPAAATLAGPAPAAAAAKPIVAASRVMASPATRRRAREAGLELATVVGSGPRGRILQSDVVAASTRAGMTAAVSAPAPAVAKPPPAATTEIKVIGLRRLIAERMSESKRTIPHFAYVEEVDVTELESLRRHLNETHKTDGPGSPTCRSCACAHARAQNLSTMQCAL
jgi:2-oxoisovalerate dehydrogenase E2 component (dihydrolipoyl transacylase)